jgi:KDO2-lipid IV(A) lauroyltransferase
MARPSSSVVLWGQYLVARLAAMGLGAFEVEPSLRAAGTLGAWLYRIGRRQRERMVRHLRWSFPELSEPAIEGLAIRSCQHVAQLFVEVCQAPRLIHADSWSSRLRIVNLTEAIRLLNTGKPAILVTGHLGNWEVLGYLMAVLGYPVDAIARPIDNPLVNDWLLGIRQRRGLRIITKWNATDKMLAVLAGGGMLGFIADQNAGDKGLFVPFFGRLASTYKSIGLLAMNQNVPIICGYARRIGDEYRYELGTTDIIYPDDWAGRPDPLYYITARYMRAIETMIRECPEQYLWMHRRWRSRPAHERAGKPMPAGLRRKLEDLPWMDAATMDRLMNPPPPEER